MFDFDIKRTCCFTGPRPDLIYGYDVHTNLYRLLLAKTMELIKFLVEERGITTFLSGGALGGDTIFFVAVDRLKEQGYDIKNILCIPYEEQASRWSRQDIAFYEEMKCYADELIFVNEEGGYESENIYEALQNRNNFMIDYSSYVVTMWTFIKKRGTYKCLQYAKSKPHIKHIYHIDVKTHNIRIIEKEEI